MQWTIIYTYYQEPIHLDIIKHNNPDADIIAANIYDPNLTGKDAWRNCDKLVRNWLRNNKHLIKNKHVCIAEYDVYMNLKLPADLDINNQLYCSAPAPNPSSFFLWFSENERLGRLQQYAFGTALFCLYLMDRECIEYWLDEEFDYLYNEDIFCELRFGTIMNYKGVNISRFGKFLKWNLKAQPTHLNEQIKKQPTYLSNPGIYHPVKQRV
jgi:hypothetical protein